MTDESIDEILTANDTWGDAPPFVPSDRKAESRSASQFRIEAERLASCDDPLLERGTLGSYQLHRRIGRGGMGTVYAAYDPLNQRPVAIKILHSALSHDEVLRRRFQREARLLSEVDSVHVTQLYDFAEADGCCFLVQELVEGQSLAELIKSSGPLVEHDALSISIDVAKALIELHKRGIVHRDIKPENILLCARSPEDGGSFLAKLTDLGIARQEATQESLALTSAQSMLGTPLYMSPEHFYGGAQVSNLSDLYSLGATLFHALTGRPPFQADTALALADAHRHSPAPNPQSINKQLSDGVCEVVRKSLQKRPDLRYQSAEEFLKDLHHLQRGEATSVTSHPLLPDARTGRIADFSFSWQLNSSPEVLWPFISNTERLNRAINLPAMTFTNERDATGQHRRMAAFRLAGIRMQWQEHMYEWIEGHRMCILREFERGPVFWLTSIVELNRRADGGTTLTHSFKASCRNLAGLLFVRFQLQFMTRRALDRVYHRIDKVAGAPPQPDLTIDPFEERISMTKRSRLLLDQIVARLNSHADAVVLERIAEYVRSASAQDVGRIRPRALAKTLRLPEPSVVNVCLQGAYEGLFDIRWDVICPSCRIAAESQDSMENIRRHVRCNACDFDFETDFATGVELILQTSPLIRKPDTGHYCIGGPAHSPHVAAQVRVAAGETVSLGLDLAEGRYVLRGPQLSYAIQVNVTDKAQQQRLFVDISSAAQKTHAADLQPKQQLITIANRQQKEVLVRVERCSITDDAITAIQATGLPFFRRYFPDQIVSPTQVTSLQCLTFVVVAIHDSDKLSALVGEPRFAELLRSHLEQLVEIAVGCGGSYVRTLDEGGGVLVFRNPESAVQAVRQATASIPTINDQLAWEPVIAVVQGAVSVTTINGQLEYLGTAIRMARKMISHGKRNEVITTIEFAEHLQSSGFDLSQAATDERPPKQTEVPQEASFQRFLLRFNDK